MSALLAVLLLALDVLLLAYLASVLLHAAGRAVRRWRHRHRVPQVTVRRCDGCRLTWQGEPAADLGRVELLVRRWARQRARGQARPAPGWARTKGWSRCPGCLSSRVRASGDGERTEEQPSRLSVEAVGYLASAGGLALLAVATVSLAGGAGPA